MNVLRICLIIMSNHASRVILLRSVLCSTVILITSLDIKSFFTYFSVFLDILTVMLNRLGGKRYFFNSLQYIFFVFTIIRSSSQQPRSFLQ